MGLLLGDLELPRGDTVGVDRDALLLRIEHRPPLNDQHIFCICCKCGFNFAPVLVCEEHRIGGRCSAFGEGNPLGNEGVLGPCPTACVVSPYSRALQTRSLGHKGRVPVYVQWSQRCGRCASEVLHPTHRNISQAVLRRRPLGAAVWYSCLLKATVRDFLSWSSNFLLVVHHHGLLIPPVRSFRLPVTWFPLGHACKKAYMAFSRDV